MNARFGAKSPNLMPTNITTYTVYILFWSSIVGGWMAWFFFTTDEQQGTPGPQWLWFIWQLDTDGASSKQVEQCAAFETLKLPGQPAVLTRQRLDLVYAVHLPKHSFSINRKCCCSFVLLIQFAGNVGLKLHALHTQFTFHFSWKSASYTYIQFHDYHRLVIVDWFSLLSLQEYFIRN